MTIDRERLRQAILDEMNGCLTVIAEKRIDELEAENRMLRKGFSFGAARVGHLSKRISHPLKLDTYQQLDVADPVKEACPNG
jgi:hypothetical protein